MIHLFIDTDNKVKYIETLPQRPIAKHSGSLLDDSYLIDEDAAALRNYQQALSLAKRNSIEVKDQDEGLALMWLEELNDYRGTWYNNTTNIEMTEERKSFIKPGVIYSIEGYKTEIIEACAHESCPVDAGCEKCKEPKYLAILSPEQRQTIFDEVINNLETHHRLFPKESEPLSSSKDTTNLIINTVPKIETQEELWWEVCVKTSEISRVGAPKVIKDLLTHFTITRNK